MVLCKSVTLLEFLFLKKPGNDIMPIVNIEASKNFAVPKKLQLTQTKYVSVDIVRGVSTSLRCGWNVDPDKDQKDPDRFKENPLKEVKVRFSSRQGTVNIPIFAFCEILENLVKEPVYKYWLDEYVKESKP